MGKVRRPFSLGRLQNNKVGIKNEASNLSNVDKDCVNKPLYFRRVPRQVSVKRYNFLCSDHQIAFDISKPCCGNLPKFGKATLRGLWHKYLSLNSDKQDTFLISHMQLVKDHLAVSCTQHVEYYHSLAMKSCWVAFKIAYSIGNMRLQRIQHRLLNGWWVPLNNIDSPCKGLIGRHVVRWMEIYFSKQCDVMPTTGRLHLSDNFTRREVYQAYKDDMLLECVPYIQYQHFNRLWRLKFNNVVIPRKVWMGVCSICASLNTWQRVG